MFAIVTEVNPKAKPKCWLVHLLDPFSQDQVTVVIDPRDVKVASNFEAWRDDPTPRRLDEFDVIS